MKLIDGEIFPAKVTAIAAIWIAHNALHCFRVSSRHYAPLRDPSILITSASSESRDNYRLASLDLKFTLCLLDIEPFVCPYQSY